MFRYVAAAAATLLLSVSMTVATSASHEEAPRTQAAGCCRNNRL